MCTALCIPAVPPSLLNKSPLESSSALVQRRREELTAGPLTQHPVVFGPPTLWRSASSSQHQPPLETWKGAPGRGVCDCEQKTETVDACEHLWKQGVG